MKKLLLIFIVNFVNAQQNYIDYQSPYHPIEGRYGMVVSQNSLSSNIGIEILATESANAGSKILV